MARKKKIIETDAMQVTMTGDTGSNVSQIQKTVQAPNPADAVKIAQQGMPNQQFDQIIVSPTNSTQPAGTSTGQPMDQVQQQLSGPPPTRQTNPPQFEGIQIPYTIYLPGNFEKIVMALSEKISGAKLLQRYGRVGIRLESLKALQQFHSKALKSKDPLAGMIAEGIVKKN